MLLLWTALSLAADTITFTPEIQLRPRFEADSGRDSAPDQGNVGYITMRSRLGGALSKGDITGRIVISDVRTFGEELHTRRDYSADGLDVRIATLTWSPGDFVLDVGRIERGLHAERLMAVANWRQPGRSFDGLIAGWGNGTWALEGRAYLLREGDQADFANRDQVVPDGVDNVIVLLSGGRAVATSLAQPVVMIERDGAAELTRVTSGVFAEGTRGTLHGRFETYLQNGTQAGSRVLAGMIAARGWMAPSKHGSVGLGYELLSGDGDATDGEAHAFESSYGANHRYYGHIDMVMFVRGAWPDGQGLHDALLFGSVSPHERFTASLDLHAFVAAVPLDGSLLAVEPDLELRATLSDGLSWSNGLNLWLAPNAGESEWMAYSMLDLKL